MDYDWTVPSVSDGFPVTLGGNTDNLTVPVEAPNYTSSMGVDGLLGYFDKAGATAVKFLDSYTKLSTISSANKTAVKLADIQGSVAVAKAETELAAAQQPLMSMANLSALTGKMTGQDTVMMILAVVGIGLSVMAMKK